jgi:hypothetical protein
MFEQPTKDDIDRALATLSDEAQHRLAVQRNNSMAEAAKAGALQNTRLIIVVAEEAKKIHVEVMQQATSMLREFMQRMGITPSQIAQWARPHLEKLGPKLLELVPPCDAPDERRRIVAEYDAQFDRRLTGMLRDIEIGFVKGRGFVEMPRQDEWVGTAEAIAMLKPILTENSARLRICERAHEGLIRARAEQFHDGPRIFSNHEIPKEFWWAEGHEALKQNWAVGDFSTWIRNSLQLKAFGVTFARADIQKLRPPQNSAKPEAVALTEEDRQIISKLDELVPSAARSYKQAVFDLGDDNRLSFRGPALELREALREILDHLAPDSEVTAAPEYRQEKEGARPTTRQKVRFIMKKKGSRSSSDAPEHAVTAFEEAVARLTRAVYERSSKEAHVAGERGTVIQIRRYLVAIFHEILGT